MSSKRPVKFVYFIMGKGRQGDIDVLVSEEAETKYKEIVALGLRCTIEFMPRTMQANVCIEDATRGDFVNQVVPAKDAPERVETVLTGFDKETYRRWVAAMGVDVES